MDRAVCIILSAAFLWFGASSVWQAFTHRGPGYVTVLRNIDPRYGDAEAYCVRVSESRYRRVHFVEGAGLLALGILLARCAASGLRTSALSSRRSGGC